MDLDTLLRTSAAVPDPAPRVLRSGRAALDAAVLDASTRRSAAIRRVRRRRNRRLSVTALVASAAAAALVLAPAIGLGGKSPTSSAQAAEVLMQAGAAAGEQPGGWADVEYWHSVSTYSQGTEQVVRREAWIGHSQPGVLIDAGVSSGVMRLSVAGFSAGSRVLSWDELYALPTEPGALEAELRAGIQGAGPDDDTELFTIVGDLLRDSPASPALRRGLWEVAARTPGITLVGPVTDSVGRPGTAIDRAGQRYVRYVVDVQDGRLLEESYGSAVPAAEAPDGIGWRATYLEQGPADSVPASVQAPTTLASTAETN